MIWNSKDDLEIVSKVQNEFKVFKSKFKVTFKNSGYVKCEIM